MKVTPFLEQVFYKVEYSLPERLEHAKVIYEELHDRVKREIPQGYHYDKYDRLCLFPKPETNREDNDETLRNNIKDEVVHLTRDTILNGFPKEAEDDEVTPSQAKLLILFVYVWCTVSLFGWRCLILSSTLTLIGACLISCAMGWPHLRWDIAKVWCAIRRNMMG